MLEINSLQNDTIRLGRKRGAEHWIKISYMEGKGKERTDIKVESKETM